MKDDDQPVGRILSRREALEVLGTLGAVLLGVRATSSAANAYGSSGAAGSVVPRSGAGTEVCVVRPAQTEGPYFVDSHLHRADIRANAEGGDPRPGTPLALTLLVSRLRDGSCEPLPGAHVDLWQCDARGVYSGVRDSQFESTGQSFLRGYQVTDDEGAARFLTIYPGWYRGRTVHTHFKIRTDPSERRGAEFTSQLYFDDSLTDRVHRSDVYSTTGGRRTRNIDDGIFRRDGDQLMLIPVEQNGGFEASFSIALATG